MDPPWFGSLDPAALKPKRIHNTVFLPWVKHSCLDFGAELPGQFKLNTTPRKWTKK
jgi:hypothetical protein